jgi:hypothetical protein
MNANMLKLEIRNAAIGYAQKLNLAADKSYKSAIIFLNLSDNFQVVQQQRCPSYEYILSSRYQTLEGR